MVYDVEDEKEFTSVCGVCRRKEEEEKRAGEVARTRTGLINRDKK